MKGYIYGIFVDDKCRYVGQTYVSVKHRKRMEISVAFNKKLPSYKSRISRGIRRYQDKVEWRILIVTEGEDDSQFYNNLDSLEREYIRRYNTFKSSFGWNSTRGGNNGKRSPEIGKKISRVKRYKTDSKIDIEEAKNLYLKGHSMGYLGHKYGVTGATLKTRLEELGVPIRKQTNAYTIKINAEIDFEEMVNLYKEGYSITALGDKYNIERYIIRHRLIQLNIPLRKSWETARLNNNKKVNKEELKSLYEQGLTIRELSKHYNIARKSMRRILIDSGITLRKHSAEKTIKIDSKLDLDDIKQSYLNGCSLIELANKYRVSHIVIRKRLEKMGVNIRTKGEQVKTKIDSQIDIDEIKKLYLNGMTAKDISKKYDNVSESSIRLRIKELGIHRDKERDIDIEQLKHLYLNGHGILPLSEKFGVSANVIRLRLKRMGLYNTENDQLELF